MGNCHYCMNCGCCRGEQPPPIRVRRCPICGQGNELGSDLCSACGASLELQAGTTALSPGKRKSELEKQ